MFPKIIQQAEEMADGLPTEWLFMAELLCMMYYSYIWII
jgi:hypothetical protein